MNTPDYVYRVKAIEKVTDGDTYWLHLDVGFRQSQLTHLRLNGWDCPEMNRGTTFEKAEAIRARDVAADFLWDDSEIWCRTYKDPDNFGRWLCDLWTDFIDLGTYLSNEDLATRWPTRWRDTYDTQ